MYRIEGISSDYKQKRTIQLPDGSAFTLRMQYVPLQQGWFISDISYKDFSLHGMRICVSPNILHQHRNKVPFGILVMSKGDREPTLQQDFASDAVKMYVLDQADVVTFTRLLSGV